MSKSIEILVRDFHSNLQSYKDKNTKFNEQMTRQIYIDNFLANLGWDITNPNSLSYNDREVVVEEYLETGDKPDYTIRLNGRNILHVEAKKVSIDILNDWDAALQTRRYGWNSGHGISILTNFEYLVIYRSFKKPEACDSVNTERYKVYKYTEYIEKFDEIYSLLSRKNIQEGKFDKWVDSISPEKATKFSLDNVFLEKLNNWRVLVGNDLLQVGKEAYFDEIYLNDVVQEFINQIIFLRFAEDNNLEKIKILPELLKKKTYVKYFKELDEKYNSGLFTQTKVIEEIKYETLKEIVEDLYFPNASYDFSIIELSILSRIYEKFLQEELVIKDGMQVELNKTKSATVKQVVSTPNNIVKFMVREALKSKTSGLSPTEVLKLKVADVAVGSGIFLIEAFNYLEGVIIDWYAMENECKPNRNLIPFDMKKQLVNKVLYGFDINSNAVQLTKFSLCLRLLTDENISRTETKNILPNLENIVTANALISDEDVDVLKLSADEFDHILPMSYEAMEKTKFDIILGNPPYLKKEDIKKITNEKEIKIYQTKYTTAFKQYDKYFLFIEKIHYYMNENAICVLLIPNKFISVGAAEKLREFFMKKKSLSAIYDFKHEQLFDNVTNYVAIIKINEFDKDEFTYTIVKNIDEPINDFIEYNLNELDKKHWFLTSDENLLKRYKFTNTKLPKITKELKAVNGIQTSKNDVYVIEGKEIIEEDNEYIYFNKKIEKGIEKFKIEKNIVKSYYNKETNCNGSSYSYLENNSYVIFPYRNGKIIDEDNLKLNFPYTYQYFVKNKYKLLPKECGGNRDVQAFKEWYQFGRTQFLTETDKEKILVGVLSDRPNFNIDRSGMLFASGGTAGYIALFKNENSLYSLEYLSAWLSHPFIDEIFKVIGTSFEGEFYSHGTSTYKFIPLLDIDFQNSEEKRHHDEITKNVQEISMLNEKIKIEVVERKKKFYEKQKNKLINNVNISLETKLNEKYGREHE